MISQQNTPPDTDSRTQSEPKLQTRISKPAIKRTRVLSLKGAAILALMVGTTASTTLADPSRFATLRLSPLAEQPESPRMALTENKDQKRVRNYPMQPPTIPHKIDGYAVNLNANKCLSCHNRTLVKQSQAPMVSVTHFMNRDGNFLAEVSPRRYFCNQCHVVQVDAEPLVENSFQDVNSLLATDK